MNKQVLAWMNLPSRDGSIFTGGSKSSSEPSRRGWGGVGVRSFTKARASLQGGCLGKC